MEQPQLTNQVSEFQSVTSLRPIEYGELTVNQRCCLIGMLDARMRIHDNIDPNWTIEVCK